MVGLNQRCILVRFKPYFILFLLNILKIFSLLMTYHRVCNWSNTTDITSGSGTAYPSGAPEFTPGFQWGSCCSMFRFLCRVLQIVVCPFISFCEEGGRGIMLSVLHRFTVMITPLVSSNSFSHNVYNKKDLSDT